MLCNGLVTVGAGPALAGLVKPRLLATAEAVFPVVFRDWAKFARGVTELGNEAH